MIRIQTEDFDTGAEVAALTRGSTALGAVVTFTGLVRDHAGSAAVTAMTLEHYPGMTERELARIEAEAVTRFTLDRTLIIHRIGRLLPGEQIVLVVAAASHRQAAFDGAAFLMDYLKTDAPFWKKEETPDGARWVDARDSDAAAKARWEG